MFFFCLLNTFYETFLICLKSRMPIGGLQILHHNQCVDVPPVPGAIMINIDLLQARFM
ncbi:putative deacetoxyvindoline 4-hydroxylase [Helianthus anomalus]